MSEPARVERHYTLRQVHEKLPLSIPKLRRLEREGKLRGVRIAGRLMFTESAIREYLESCANAPRRVPPPALNGGR